MFNALRYSKELEEAGFSREQAEATINVFFRFMDHQFATKEDLIVEIESLRKELKTDISDVRADLASMRYDMKALEYRMTIKLGIMQMASIGLLTALLKLF